MPLLEVPLLEPELVPDVELLVPAPLVPDPIVEEDVPLPDVLVGPPLTDEAEPPPVELVSLVPFDPGPVVVEPLEPPLELGEHDDVLVAADSSVSEGSVGMHVAGSVELVVAGSVDTTGSSAAPPPVALDELGFLRSRLIALFRAAVLGCVFSTADAALCTTAAVDGKLCAGADGAAELVSGPVAGGRCACFAARCTRAGGCGLAVIVCWISTAPPAVATAAAISVATWPAPTAAPPPAITPVPPTTAAPPAVALPAVALPPAPVERPSTLVRNPSGPTAGLSAANCRVTPRSSRRKPRQPGQSRICRRAVAFGRTPRSWAVTISSRISAHAVSRASAACASAIRARTSTDLTAPMEIPSAVASSE